MWGGGGSTAAPQPLPQSRGVPEGRPYPEEVAEGEGEADGHGCHGRAPVVAVVEAGEDAEDELGRQEQLHHRALARAHAWVQLPGGDRAQHPKEMLPPFPPAP